MKDIKGIILDIDGVIVGEKIGFNTPNPNPIIIEKLKKINEQGIKISLCTAKPHFAIKSIVDDAKLNNLHITDGGGVIINPIDNVIIKKYIINKELAKQVIKTYIENNIYVEFYTIDDYFIQKNQICNITDQHTYILQKEPKIIENLMEESLKHEITKIMPVALNEKDKEIVDKVFRQLEIALTLSWGVHPIALPLQFGIITAPNISKKQGTIDISKSTNIPLDNMLGVGDSTSDWNFISLCKYAGAMGNASQELKELVLSKGKEFSYIGKHVDDNGILDILDFFLK